MGQAVSGGRDGLRGSGRSACSSGGEGAGDLVSLRQIVVGDAVKIDGATLPRN